MNFWMTSQTGEMVITNKNKTKQNIWNRRMNKPDKKHFFFNIFHIWLYDFFFFLWITNNISHILWYNSESKCSLPFKCYKINRRDVTSRVNTGLRDVLKRRHEGAVEISLYGGSEEPVLDDLRCHLRPFSYLLLESFRERGQRWSKEFDQLRERIDFDLIWWLSDIRIFCRVSITSPGRDPKNSSNPHRHCCRHAIVIVMVIVMVIGIVIAIIVVIVMVIMSLLSSLSLSSSS